MTNDEALRQALRWAAVGELSSRVAHESNNLLAGILGQAELGLLSHDPARMKSSLEAIVKSSRELKAVTERLMVFTKLVEPSTRNTNLLEIFRTLFGMMERSYLKAGITVEHHYGNLPMTWCDPGGASPPMLYMLRFALESLRVAGGGTARLEASSEGSEIVFGVQATPCEGTKAEDIPIRPGDLTREQVAGFAEREGGTFSFEQSGAGFVMGCRFPVRRDPAVANVRTAATGMAAAAMAGGLGLKPGDSPGALTVLVVEDEPPIRELFHEVLSEAGCRVHCEADGPSAIRTFGAHRFDVVFTDLSLPGMDGLELAGRLRALEPGVVIVMVTGQANERSIQRSLETGAAMVMQKPFELHELQAVLGSLRSDPSGRSLRESSRSANVAGAR